MAEWFVEWYATLDQGKLFDLMMVGWVIYLTLTRVTHGEVKDMMGGRGDV